MMEQRANDSQQANLLAYVYLRYMPYKSCTMHLSYALVLFLNQLAPKFKLFSAWDSDKADPRGAQSICREQCKRGSKHSRDASTVQNYLR